MQHIKHRTLFISMLSLLVVFCIMLWLPAEYVFLDQSYDKHYHLGVFCVLTLLVSASTHLSLIKLSLLMVSLGALLELSQIWLPSRSSSWLDLQANLLGVAAGLIIILSVRLFKKLRT